jgi:hypothetical protein
MSSIGIKPDQMTGEGKSHRAIDEAYDVGVLSYVI